MVKFRIRPTPTPNGCIADNTGIGEPQEVLVSGTSAGYDRVTVCAACHGAKLTHATIVTGRPKSPIVHRRTIAAALVHARSLEKTTSGPGGAMTANEKPSLCRRVCRIAVAAPLWSLAAHDGRGTFESIEREDQAVPYGPSHLVVALLRRDFVERIRFALQDYMVTSARRATDLLLLSRAKPLSLVVTEPWDWDKVPVAPVIQTLKAEFPSVPVIAYCEVTAKTCREAVTLARAGIDSIILRGLDDGPTALRAAFGQIRRDVVRRELMQHLRQVVNADTATFIEHCLLRAGDTVSIGGAAKALGVDRKTLLNRFKRQHPLTPRELLAWCRILVAAELLEDPGRSVHEVGLALGCGSGAALRNLFLRHAKLRPLTIRARGGLRYALALFIDALQSR